MTPILYILSRSYASDLQTCNAGKVAAQACHAANMISENCKTQPIYKEWAGTRGFGTTVVLSATREDIEQVKTEFVESTIADSTYVIVTDPSYPFFVDNDVGQLLIKSTDLKSYDMDLIKTTNGKSLMTRKEVTCSGLLCYKEQIEMFFPTVAKLSLHP